MGFPNFGKKNKGGKLDLPTRLKTPKGVTKEIHRTKPKKQV